jgi:hypothetical protein
MSLVLSPMRKLAHAVASKDGRKIGRELKAMSQ